ncbi:MAG: hypothetical protein JWM34_2185 [Ilumatobacteraceae bacterium]|nr:hypothetical protein [Ilumatobacteraceae bacterium]
MSAHLIKHALRLSAGGNDGYHPEGWNPKLRMTVMGPTPPDSELVWTVVKPDGSVWFEHSVALPELADEEMHTASLQKWESGTDITDVGSFGFTIRIVNELDGVDELLHDGRFEVTRLDPDQTWYGVDHSALLTTGLVALDVYDEHDAPKVRATAFLGGSVDTYEVEAHLFLDGKRFAKASSVDGGYDFTSNDGQTLAREFIAEFDSVRGWNNLTDQGWGDDDWHLLDAHPGAYEVKFTRGGKVNRTMSFVVGDDGRIVKDDLIEPDGAGRPALWRAAEIVGTFDGDAVADASAPRAYGDETTSTFDYSPEGMYWFRNAPAAAPEPSAFDDETLERIQRVADRAELLLATWESTMAEGPDPSYTSNFVPQCEAVERDVAERFVGMYGELGGVADGVEVSMSGEPTTLGEAAARVLGLAETARQHLGVQTDAAEAVLTPFRAILRNDKLAIFEDHPAPSFLYLTTNKHVIETPDELAAATLWCFEGASDTDVKGTVDGVQVTGSVSGWRVLGYQFDDGHVLVDEWEVQGTGSSAPKSAFVAREQSTR